MRLLPCLTGLLLITTAAAAQPAPNAGPGYDPGQQQGAPGPGYDPGQAQGTGAEPQAGGRRAHVSFKQRFETANVTHDGRLTLDQARQGHILMVAKNFDQIDADHKGYVTVQDVHAWHHARHQARAAQDQPAPAQ